MIGEWPAGQSSDSWERIDRTCLLATWFKPDSWVSSYTQPILLFAKKSPTN